MDHPVTARLRAEVERALEAFLGQYPAHDAHGLYAPVHYLMALGGKRLRPVLTLVAAEAEGDRAAALPAAVAVELFHNFTLMHDDIMDEAPLRRGQPTVHARWDVSAAILSGDAMYTLAVTALAQSRPDRLPGLLACFNRTALEVCIGQQADMAFAGRTDVTVADYLEMIRLKTSVLVAASCALGAEAAGASAERVAHWYRFGERVGLAFQLQDDLLDAFGEATGKQVGGDILADKQTFLMLHAQAEGDAGLREELARWAGPTDRPQAKIDEVTAAMRATGADDAARALMERYAAEAAEELAALEVGDPELASALAGLTRHAIERTV
jgi:geranylgeranyl diphosphate synthase type II